MKEFGLVPGSSAAKHLVWTKGRFKKYGRGERKEYAVCTLCIVDKRWNTAEVKYGTKKSTTNLLNHLDSDERPGHRERHNRVHGISSGTSGQQQSTILAFVKPNDEDQKEKLVRWIVDTNQPLSVRSTAVLLSRCFSPWQHCVAAI